jgi:hypothetical protein
MGFWAFAFLGALVVAAVFGADLAWKRIRGGERRAGGRGRREAAPRPPGAPVLRSPAPSEDARCAVSAPPRPSSRSAR